MFLCVHQIPATPAKARNDHKRFRSICVQNLKEIVQMWNPRNKQNLSRQPAIMTLKFSVGAALSICLKKWSKWSVSRVISYLPQWQCETVIHQTDDTVGVWSNATTLSVWIWSLYLFNYVILDSITVLTVGNPMGFNYVMIDNFTIFRMNFGFQIRMVSGIRLRQFQDHKKTSYQLLELLNGKLQCWNLLTKSQIKRAAML